MNLIDRLSELDFITVTDLVEDLGQADMVVIDVAEMDGSLYILAASPDDELDEDEDLEEVDSSACLFKVCEEQDAEMLIEEDDTDFKVYVTTDFPSEELTKAARLFTENGDFDLEIESENDD